MSGEELSWSADSNYVLGGSADGSVVVWDLTPPKGESKLEAVQGLPPATLMPAISLRPPGEGDISPARAVAFNPRYSLLGVGGQEFSMWLSEDATQVEEGW
jgi:COMPASS component SWD2